MDADDDDLIAETLTLSEAEKELVRRMRAWDRELAESEQIPQHNRNLIMVRLAKRMPSSLTKSQIVALLRARYRDTISGARPRALQAVPGRRAW